MQRGSGATACDTSQHTAFYMRHAVLAAKTRRDIQRPLAWQVCRYTRGALQQCRARTTTSLYASAWNNGISPSLAGVLPLSMLLTTSHAAYRRTRYRCRRNGGGWRCYKLSDLCNTASHLPSEPCAFCTSPRIVPGDATRHSLFAWLTSYRTFRFTPSPARRIYRVLRCKDSACVAFLALLAVLSGIPSLRASFLLTQYHGFIPPTERRFIPHFASVDATAATR